MKTSVDISDALFEDIRKLASARNTSMKSLIEHGLREVLKQARQEKRRTFKLRKASFRGRGLQAPYRDASWSQIRDAIYTTRGSTQ